MDNKYAVEMKEVKKSFGGIYALKNVNERLTLEYGDGSALTFLSMAGSGTTVRFRIEKAQMR